MLCYQYGRAPSEHDLAVYESVVPQDHFLRDALELVPWKCFGESLEKYYSKDLGRPALEPTLMLKLEYLRYHFNLSDRDVIDRCRTDLAMKFFLQLPIDAHLPDPSLLCKFRGRIGTEGFLEVFNALVSAARERGFVKNRLRIKDATHVIGNVAVPTALALVAQCRDKLLDAAEPFDPEQVEGERVALELLRTTTQSIPSAERLVSRLVHLQGILLWCDRLAAPEKPESNRFWQAFLVQRDLAHKIFEDQNQHARGDKTLSVSDPDVRRGKHGEFFDGYLVDILLDADSELITQINVLSATGPEAMDAVTLLSGEQAAGGNQVQSLSIDGVGFHGEMLRQLESPDGMKTDVYVPVPADKADGLFTPRDFRLDSDSGVLVCPAGQRSTAKRYDETKKATSYGFRKTTCATCPLLSRCMKSLPTSSRGRTVCISDFTVEHTRARERAQSEGYREVRQEHPKVERKLGEMMNRHGGRRARYRGRAKVYIQQLMVAVATNTKRFVKLEAAQLQLSM